MSFGTQTIDILSAVTTATVTTILLKKGLRNVWMGQDRSVAQRGTWSVFP